MARYLIDTRLVWLAGKAKMARYLVDTRLVWLAGKAKVARRGHFGLIRDPPKVRPGCRRQEKVIYVVQNGP